MGEPEKSAPVPLRPRGRHGWIAAVAAAVAGAAAGVVGHSANAAARAPAEEQAAVDIAVIKNRLDNIERLQGEMRGDLRQLLERRPR